MTLVIGLTGGIGSGKSAVADAFAALGVPVTDTDQLAHALTESGEPGFRAILEAFGNTLLRADGSLDRARLRERVFSDGEARARLEGILHPLIRAAALREVAGWSGPYGILVVPLLLERGGLAGVVNRILVVDCSEEEQIRRVTGRSGLAESEVRAIMSTQLPRARRLAAAHDVIDNSGPFADIEGKVEDLDRRYRALAAAGARSANGL